MPGFGRNSFIGWALESPWGTPVAATKFAELISEGIEAIRNREPRPVVRDLDVREGNFYDALFGVRGPFAIEANYIGMLRLFEHLFGDGSVATVETEAGLRWTHTFTLKDTIMSAKGLTLHVNTDVDPGSTPQKRAYGFKLNSATLSMDPTRNLQVEFEGAGKNVDIVAAVSPTFPSITTYVAGHACVIEIDDVVRATDSVELVLDNGLDLEKRVLGDKQIGEPIRSDTRRSITGTLTLDALQADLSKYLAGTLFKLEMLHTGPVLAAGNYRLDLTAAKCEVTADPYHVTGPGVMKSTIPFRVQKPTAGEMLTLVVVNNESAVA